MHRLMGFWRVQIRALGAPDRFHLTKPNTFQRNREASVATLRWCSGPSRSTVRLPSGTAFSFAGIPTELETLKSYLGGDLTNLAVEDIAAAVIRRELKLEGENEGSERRRKG